MQYIYQDLEKLELEDPKEQTKLETNQNRLSNLLSNPRSQHKS